MKISDEGLQQILSLGLKKETSTPGVYFLYEWENVKYIAVPNIEVATPSDYPEAVKIVLTPNQYSLIRKIDTGSVSESSNLDSEKFKPTTDYYENLVLLTFNQNSNEFNFKESYGTNKMTQNFKCGIDQASPLKIIYDTQKAYHGIYQPIPHFDECLKLANISLENLWVTAYPLLSAGKLIGATFAYTNKAVVAVEVLDEFKNLEAEYIKVLTI